MTPDEPSRSDVDASYARHWSNRAWWRLEGQALQSGSTSLRDVFALAASGGRTPWSTLRQTLRNAREAPTDGKDEAVVAVRSWNPRPLRSLARVLGNRPVEPDDSRDALAVFELLAEHHEGSLTDADGYLYVEVADAFPDDAAYRRALATTTLGRLDPVHVALLAANRVGDPGSRTWTACVNTALTVSGFEPVAVGPGVGTPFDRVEAVLAPPIPSRPLVSVVVATFEPDGRLDTAVRSLLAQTWQRLEIVVVDDCSSPAAQALVAALSAQDPRVTVLRNPDRRGVFASRNAGLRAASGTFITCLDDDDWAHPRKIETQVAALIAQPTLLGCLSRHVRATDDLMFTRVNINPRLSQPNFSSLMMRRDQLLDQFGGWDEISRGSDAELLARVEAAGQAPLPVVGAAPLSFSRYRPGSLSFGQLARGYVDPRRLAHRHSYERWHRSLSTDWRIPPSADRPFPLPTSLDPFSPFGPGGPVETDAVLVADFRRTDSTPSLLAEARARLNRRESVGLLHLDSPWTISATILVEDYWDLLREGAHLLTLADDATTAEVVVGDPSTLAYAENTPSRLSSRLTTIVRRPRAAGPNPRFHPPTVERNATRMFGGTVRWRPPDSSATAPL